MSGTRNYNFREGDRSEYFAQVLLSGIGLCTPIPRQEDIGFDFLCSLSDQQIGTLTFGSPFLLSVKSISAPNIELLPTETAIKADTQYHIDWLFRNELPAFLGVVDKAKFQISFYSLVPVWFIYYEGGPICGSMTIKPRLDPLDLSHVGQPRIGNGVPGWPGKYHFDVDLGHPIAVLDLDVLKNRDATASVKKHLRGALKHAQTSQTHANLKVPYFQWLAITKPGGGDFHPAFALFPLPPNRDARDQITKELLPSLISLALYFKQNADIQSLEAIRILLKDVPAGFFEDPIREALPEIIPLPKSEGHKLSEDS